MKRNKFSLSHYKLFTGNMGKLIPIAWYEVLPGDSVRQRTSLFLRMQALLAPIMHPVRINIRSFYVPYRILNDAFPGFITGGEDGQDDTEWPYITVDDLSGGESGLLDYLGIPPIDYDGNTLDLSAYAPRAYNLIFNEYYRDPQLVEEREIDFADGFDDSTDLTMADVPWEQDYFTTARPDDTLGTDVTIPLTGDAPVTGIGPVSQTYPVTPTIYETDGTGGRATTNGKTFGFNAVGNMDYTLGLEEDPDNAGFPNIRADLSAVSGVPISDLRFAIAVQKFMENRNTQGGDFLEFLRQYGVKGLDARLQKPEYLGGGRATVQFSEVLDHTSAGTLGAMGGHGIAGLRTRRFKRFIPEHGLVMTLMSVMPKPIYADGVNKKWLRDTKWKYFQHELQGIGDQEVLDIELYADAADKESVFGYQMKYDCYKWHPSEIAGEFRSTNDHWHLARMFEAEPSLNEAFVYGIVPQSRILASSATDAFYSQASHSIQLRRLMNRSGKTYLEG